MFFDGNWSPKMVPNISSSLYKFPHTSRRGATSYPQPSESGLALWIGFDKENAVEIIVLDFQTQDMLWGTHTTKQRAKVVFDSHSWAPSWQPAVIIGHVGGSHWTFQATQTPRQLTQTHEEEEHKPMQPTLVSPGIIKHNKMVVILSHRILGWCVTQHINLTLIHKLNHVNCWYWTGFDWQPHIVQPNMNNALILFYCS